ncbi:MAG TPA: hypothetical protein VML54_09570 [Candidatus Limnocylindrales bacterium]|nr:hypothetical protein [Candidatus Limnocylindrales bacterium]
MAEHQGERETVPAAMSYAPESDPHCQLCGAPHDPDDPVLCAACGEPVLRWGWAP